MERPLIHLRAITKHFDKPHRIDVLKGINLDVIDGERTVILGRSGAGKSTLLNILGLLDTPSSGTYELDGIDTHTLSSRRRDRLRGEEIGFVFQDYHVLHGRTVRENLELKLAITRENDYEHRITTALDMVGLSHRKHSQARLLSGGEKQRLAIARALINNPKLILADEPTGNLDKYNSQRALAILAQQDAAIVIITHDDSLVEWADTAYTLADGTLEKIR